MRTTIFSTAALLSTVLCAPTQNTTKLSSRTIHRFSNGTWIENMAIRENGQILMTDLTGSRIYLVDPSKPDSAPTVHQFANSTCVTGITELETDIFYTQSIACINPYESQFQANSSTIWEVNMRQYARTGSAIVREIATISAIGLPNGLCRLPQRNSTLLVADSLNGVIWQVDIRSGQYSIFMNDPSLKPVATAELQIGVNGVKVSGSTLYYTNTNQGIIGTTSLASDGTPIGSPHVLTNAVPGADDFDIDNRGNLWAAWNAGNSLYHVSSSNGTVSTFVPQDPFTGFFGPTRTSFGRGRNHGRTLYVTTAGFEFGPNGTLISDRGGLFAFDISHVS